MTEEQIEQSLQTGKLKLSNWGKFSHYGIVYFLLIIPTVFLFFHVRYYFQGIAKPLRDGEISLPIITLLLAFLFYRLQKNRLKFESVETNLNRDELDKIIKSVAKKLKWTTYVNNEKIVLAKTNPSFFSGSWGEQITILFDRNRILINSICDPDSKSSVVSMGRNKKNINSLIEEINKASR